MFLWLVTVAFTFMFPAVLLGLKPTIDNLYSVDKASIICFTNDRISTDCLVVLRFTFMVVELSLN